jgi:hypothetical protein
MGGLKGQRIFNAAYTVLNEFEDVRGHSMTSSKSMAHIQDMLVGIQDGLKKSNNPPTEFLYTDSPQGKCLMSFCEGSFNHGSAERSFHESINSSLTRNVVPIHDWTDLPCFERSPETPTTVVSDSIDIEEVASDLLEHFMAVPLPSSQLHLVALAVKMEQRPGESPRLDIIQLRTRDKIHIFKVQ